MGAGEDLVSLQDLSLVASFVCFEQSFGFNKGQEAQQQASVATAEPGVVSCL